MVFGGFAAEELADRIKNSKPSMIIAGSVGIEPKKQIAYFPIVHKALQLVNAEGQIPVLLVQRDVLLAEPTKNDNVVIYNDEVEKK